MIQHEFWQIAFFIFVSFPFQISSQISTEHLERVPLEDLQYVKSIVEDHEGLLWFGTGQGVIRYDGTHIKSYLHISSDTSSISDNNIEDLLVDHKGQIWISTNHGLNCLNPSTGRSKKYYHDPNHPNSLSSDYTGKITEDTEGNIWIGSVDGLNKIDHTSGQVIVYKHDKNDSLSISPGKIFLVFTDHLKRYWVGTDHGLNLFDPSTNQFQHFLSGQPAPTLGAWTVLNILEDNAGILWLATWGEGLVRFNPRNGSYKTYWESPDKKHRGDHNVFFDIAFSDEEKKYVYVASSDNNFSIFDIQHEVFIRPAVSPDKASVAQEGQSLLLDSRGTLWIGSKGSTFKIPASKNLFAEFNYSASLNGDCLSSVFSAFEEINQDGTPVLWLGTWTCGLIKAEYQNNKAVSLTNHLNQPGRENFRPVTSLLRDKKGVLWVGTEDGLFQQTTAGELKKMYAYASQDSTSLSHDGIECMIEDNDDNLWIGTWNGLNVYDREKDHFIRYFPLDDLPGTKFNPNTISKIIALPSGDLLILADQKNIIRFDRSKNKFSLMPPSFTLHIDSIGYLKDFIIDSKDELWCAGTQGVLNIKNIFSVPSFKIFTTVHGLSFDYATRIVEDDCGHIWIATRRGLNMYVREEDAFKQFYSYDGLYANNTEGYLIKGTSGNIIVAYGLTEKNEAINYFNPCEWKNEALLTPVKITGIKIFNKDSGLVNTVFDAHQIHLRSNDRMITFEFVELNYLHPDHNKYAYMLEGFDKDWIYNGSNTTATYTNLDGGTYTFRVKAVNDVNAVKENMAMMSLTVTPLFYKTPWFILLCIAVTAMAFYTAYALRVRQLKKLHAIRLGISHDLHDDIGSRLSSISILTQLADQKKSDPNFNMSKIFEQVSKGSKESMELMNDIVWSVNPKYDKLNNTLIRMREYASEILEAKNIEFKFVTKAPLQTMMLPMKIRKDFYLIFKEAINNLAKYSESTQATISILKEDNILHLIIEDNGQGFDINTIKKGNGLSNMQTRAEALHGKLMIRSLKGHGTAVHLEIPVA